MSAVASWAASPLETLHLGQVHALEGVSYEQESSTNVEDIVRSQLANLQRLLVLSQSRTLYVFNEGLYTDLNPRESYPDVESSLDIHLFMAFKDFQFDFDSKSFFEGHFQLLYEHGAARIALALGAISMLYGGESDLLNQQISLFRDSLLTQMQAEGLNSAYELRRRLRADPNARVLIMDRREEYLLDRAMDLLPEVQQSRSTKPPLVVLNFGAAHKFAMASKYPSLSFSRESASKNADRLQVKCSTYLN